MNKHAIKSIKSKKERDFAEACYDNNSISELLENNDYLEPECRDWDITEEEALGAIECALIDRLLGWMIEFDIDCESNSVNESDTAPAIIARYENVNTEDVYIDDDGMVHGGKKWWGVEDYINFYEFVKSI